MATCRGLTKKGAPCGGGAMPGMDLCGPHHDMEMAGKTVERRPLHPRPKPSARPVDISTIKRVGDKKIECPKCGLVVSTAGKLVSFHEAINGCRWDGPLG